MPSTTSIFKDVKSLNDNEIEELFNHISELISSKSLSKSIHSDSREQRYSNGVVCLHCGSTLVIKHGKKNDVQRFRYKDCGKTFNDLTLTPMANSHVKLEEWINYAKCMIMGYSIRKSARTCDVSVKTSFYMRHRLLDAVRNFQGIGEVSGIVEMDETFLPESFKGNHKKSGFKMPRESRKRGKQVKKRGISREQICIATAIDRKNNIIFEMVNKGRIKTSDLERLFKDRLDSKSLVCTDSHPSYNRFLKEYASEHIKIASGKHKNGVYHISHVNSIHSKFKKWVARFNGVATKYLPNYLHWFKWLETFLDEKEIVKTRQLLINGSTKPIDTRIEQYKSREPIFA
jgi:transposase-like protein